MKKFLSSLLIVFVTIFVAPAFATTVSCDNLATNPVKTVGVTWNESTKTMTSKTTDSRFPLIFILQVYPASGRGMLQSVCDTSFSGSTTHTCTFTSAENAALLRVYTSGAERNFEATFAIEPNTTYSFSMDVVSADPTTVGGVVYTNLVLKYAACANCDGVVKTYESATGTVSQNGTPSPTNPVEPTFYQQGDMILRKVGDYADSYDATTGKITRRIGVKTFNGTENITMFNTNGYIKSDASNVAYLLTGNEVANSSRIVSNVFSYGGASIWQSVGYPNTSKINIDNHDIYNQMHMNIANDVLGITDYTQETQASVMAKAKAFFKRMYDAGTPVTVYYVLETPVEETPASTTYCADTIKIATTAYNSARFSPVVTDLNSAVATIREIVTKTINQTAAIASLQADKQTRPEDACPAGKKCLLVETEENGVIVPHWFPIIEAPE